MTQTKTTTGKNVFLVEEVEVSRRVCFEGNRWIEAILYYLNGIWKNDSVIAPHPELRFDNVTLRLADTNYFAYVDGITPPRPRVQAKDLLAVPYSTQNDVEAGLVRFVKNNQIRQLAITFLGEGALYLTKQRRAELIISVEGLSNMDAAMRRWGFGE
jgi:hypothetical protein